MKIKLGDICEIFDGPHATPPEAEHGPIFLGIKNITESNELDLSNAKRLSEDDYKVWTKRVTPQKDDIVFSYEATLNRYALIPEGFYGCLGRRLAIVRVKDISFVDPHYLYYYFCSPVWNDFILKNKVIGSTVLRVSIEEVPNYMVEIPDISTQHLIAGFLDKIRLQIENNKAICAELEAMAKLLYDYWFVQFDFPDENGRPYKSSGGKMVWNEALKREIPEGWSIAEMGSVFEITMGSSPSGESLNENESGTEFYQGSTDFGRFYPIERVYTTSPVRFAKKQDVLMSVRAPVGNMNFALNDCCIGRGLAAIRHKSPLYAWNTLRTFQPYFDMFNGAGTTFGALTSDDLKKKLAVVPAADVLNAYCNQVASIEIALRNNERENRQLESLRDFLLPMLMNGQVSFKEV